MPTQRPAASSVNAQRTMKGTKRRDTGPELQLRAALRRNGVLGYRVDLRGLPGRPDVAFTRWKIAVFVHGCFWHQCPACKPQAPKRNREFWLEKFKVNVERDARNRSLLEASGWTVMEVWECEIHSDAARCALRIAGAIRKVWCAAAAQEEAADLGLRIRRKFAGWRAARTR
jgi:DNA mismatch endonuclease, patch repair protein